MKTSSAISYFGSDSEVAADLAAMLNHCRHVTIPFVGGAAIVPHLRAKGIVANDLNSDVINFYRVITGPRATELIEKCRSTLSHPDEIRLANKIMACSFDPVELAWAYWALCWVGRKGRGGTKKIDKTTVSFRRTADGGNNASRLQSVISDLDEWKIALRRCEWVQQDFRQLLKSAADESDCGIYADPPWVDAGDAYACSFTEQDHIDLRDTLSRFEKTTVLVRYGDHSFIRDLYRGDWNIIDAESRTQSNSVKGEIWITKGE